MEVKHYDIVAEGTISENVDDSVFIAEGPHISEGTDDDKNGRRGRSVIIRGIHVRLTYGIEAHDEPPIFEDLPPPNEDDSRLIRVILVGSKDASFVANQILDVSPADVSSKTEVTCFKNEDYGGLYDILYDRVLDISSIGQEVYFDDVAVAGVDLFDVGLQRTFGRRMFTQFKVPLELRQDYDGPAGSDYTSNRIALMLLTDLADRSYYKLRMRIYYED